jgi:hypothetical protein
LARTSLVSIKILPLVAKELPLNVEASELQLPFIPACQIVREWVVTTEVYALLCPASEVLTLGIALSL